MEVPSNLDLRSLEVIAPETINSTLSFLLGQNVWSSKWFPFEAHRWWIHQSSSDLTIRNLWIKFISKCSEIKSNPREIKKRGKCSEDVFQRANVTQLHSVVARHFMNFMDFIHFLAFSQLAIRRFRFIHKIARIKSRFNGYYPRHVHWILFPGYYSVNTIHRIQHLENLVNKVVGQRRRAFTAVSN